MIAAIIIGSIALVGGVTTFGVVMYNKWNNPFNRISRTSAKLGKVCKKAQGHICAMKPICENLRTNVLPAVNNVRGGLNDLKGKIDSINNKRR